MAVPIKNPNSAKLGKIWGNRRIRENERDRILTIKGPEGER